MLRLYECLISPVLSIGMGISVAISLSSLLGFPWTPMHPALPLLCLGIGIDDMFVIMQCLHNIKYVSTLLFSHFNTFDWLYVPLFIWLTSIS